MTTLMFSYSHKDENLRDRLEVSLSMLKRQGVIDVWHDRRIVAGDEFDHAISKELESADIILLLVSPDFLNSDYCYDVEVKRAMERHEAKETRVIPVILRPCDWHDTPFGKLLAAPKDGKPITKWPDLDEAFLDVTTAIKKAVGAHRSKPAVTAPASGQPFPERLGPRTSNLRVRKDFADVDRDRFLDDSFEFMANFFENSLEELKRRHAEIDVDYKRIDARQFTARAYKNGKVATRCKVAIGRSYGRSGEITFSHDDSVQNTGANEFLTVESDDQGLYIKSMGMQRFGQDKDKRLTFEGAAEYYWELFIAALQR